MLAYKFLKIEVANDLPGLPGGVNQLNKLVVYELGVEISVIFASEHTYLGIELTEVEYHPHDELAGYSLLLAMNITVFHRVAHAVKVVQEDHGVDAQLEHHL